VVNFYVEFQARHAVEDIRKQVATTAAVVRDGREQELPVAELVPGDIVRLNAGDLAPADGRLLDSKDLHVRESALTGESLPVDKAAGDLAAGQHTIADASNSVFLGTAVQTGIGTAVIVSHRQGHGLRRHRPTAGHAAAGDRIRPRHTPLSG